MTDAPAKVPASSRLNLGRLRLEPEHKKLSSGSHLWPIVLAIVLVVGGALLHSSQARDRGGVPKSAALEAPSLPSALPQADSRIVVAGGFLEARREAVLSPGRAGVVAAVHVKPGQLVASGDLLLELVAEDAAADFAIAAAELRMAKARQRLVSAGSRGEELNRARARSSFAQAVLEERQIELERVRRLVEQQVETVAVLDRLARQEKAARAQLDEALAEERLLLAGRREEERALAATEVERAGAALQRAEAVLNLSRLRAPFDATVVNVSLTPGEVVSMIQSPYSETGIEVADVSELWARLDVPENRIGSVSLGASALVFVDSEEFAELAAEVIEIAPVADRQSNTVSVAVRLFDPPELLRPNMRVRVTINPSAEDSNEPQ